MAMADDSKQVASLDATTATDNTVADLEAEFQASRAVGCVLFINDEACYLYKPGNEGSHGVGSIDSLLQVMENSGESRVVILAGYKDCMDRFCHSNPGTRSRIAHHIDFPDYRRNALDRAPLRQASRTVRQDLESPVQGRTQDHRGRRYPGESCVQRRPSRQRLRRVLMKGRGASLPG